MKLFLITSSLFIFLFIHILDKNEHAIKSQIESIQKLEANRQFLKLNLQSYRLVALNNTALLTKKEKIFQSSSRVLSGAKILLANLNANGSNEVQVLKYRLKNLLLELATISNERNSTSEFSLLHIMSTTEKLASDINEFEQRHWQDYLVRSKSTVEQYKHHNYLFLTLFSLMYLAFIYINFLRGQKNKVASEKRKAEDFYFQLFDSLNEGILLCDTNGYIKAVNKSAKKLLNISLDKLVGKNIHKCFKNYYFVDSSSSSKGGSTFADILSIKSPVQSIVMAFHDRDNNQSWFSINSQPVGSGEEIHSVIFSLTNITEKVNAEKLIRKQQVKIYETSKHQAIGEIASGIAHEINNPLAIISMSIEKLELKADMFEMMESVEVQKITGRVLNTVDRITKVVKGFLSYSRGERQEKEKVSLRLILNIALDLYQMKLHERGIDLIINDQNMNVEINCSPTQIAQVIINLIKNSADAISNLDDKWIRIEAIVNNQDIQISIEDSGSGISKSQVDQILKPFFTTKGFGEGTGLGLSISKTIVEEHGGNLNIQTSPNTKFIVTLPKSISYDDTMEVA